MKNGFRAWGEDGQPYFAPASNFSISFHDTGIEILMWSSDGIVDTIPVAKVDRDTGLKDKDGVEIYEGDILGKGNHKQVITWSVEKTWHGMADGYRAYHAGFHFDEYWFGLDEAKIIGNIHQNPELLEK